MAEDKYGELYVLAKEVLAEEQGRFNRIDEKASRYLSALSLLIGAVGFFGNWIVEHVVPPESTFHWLLIFAAMALFASVTTAWAFVFSVFQLHSLNKPELSTEVLQFFDDNELKDIHYGLARSYRDAHKTNRKTTDRKAARLYYGYVGMWVSVVVFLAIIVLFAVYRWRNPA